MFSTLVWCDKNKGKEISNAALLTNSLKHNETNIAQYKVSRLMGQVDLGFDPNSVTYLLGSPRQGTLPFLSSIVSTYIKGTQ